MVGEIIIMGARAWLATACAGILRRLDTFAAPVLVGLAFCSRYSTAVVVSVPRTPRRLVWPLLGSGSGTQLRVFIEQVSRAQARPAELARELFSWVPPCSSSWQYLRSRP